jgi:predicted nuclease of predicted toxin-antitoxin system
VGGPAEPASPDEITRALLDEMYPSSLAQRLRAAGHDVLAVVDVQVGLGSRFDDDVLAWAARNDRCLVTENVRVACHEHGTTLS